MYVVLKFPDAIKAALAAASGGEVVSTGPDLLRLMAGLDDYYLAEAKARQQAAEAELRGVLAGFNPDAAEELDEDEVDTDLLPNNYPVTGWLDEDGSGPVS